MTTRSMIYDFLSDNGSDHATSNRNSGIVMDLLHDNRRIVYEMLEDILQSDNLVRATETDKNPTLKQELLFICPSLAHMPRVLASVVRMVERNLEDPDDPNSEPMIDPVLTNQLLQIDRILAKRKAQSGKEG